MFAKFLAWLRSWFSQGDNLGNVYQPKDRTIYFYSNGERMVAADPLVLYRRVMEHGPELSIDIKVSNSPSKDAAKAHEALMKKLRDIFSVKLVKKGEDGEPDEWGLTETETAGLLDHFLLYCERLKKNSRTLET